MSVGNDSRTFYPAAVWNCIKYFSNNLTLCIIVDTDSLLHS